LLLAFIVLLLSLLPAPSQSPFSWTQAFQLDKLFHLLSHASIIILYFYPKINLQNPHINNKQAFISIILLMLFGCGIEVLQKYFITNRHFDWFDILANTAGDLLGLWLTKYITVFKK